MRCKACDSVMDEKDIRWYEEEQEHEELCACCLKIIEDMEALDDIATNDTDKFINDFVSDFVPKIKDD